ncbi:MAG: class I SAM-dependent methyltransferase [Acidimicrobiia bacterium]
MNGANDTFTYGPGGPTERELRLLGDVEGKRLLELGCGTGAVSIALAHQGAVVIGVDTDPERLAQARSRDDAAEVRVDWHAGDLADLAFLRADSIDAVVSVHALAEVDDIARVFRQVERVLKPSAAFVFSYEHPMALCMEPDERLVHSPFDRGPITVGERMVYVRTISDVFTELHRAGLRVDTMVEPRPPASRIPATVVWRVRTEGA